MPVQARRWDEGGEPVDELQGCERHGRAPIGAGLGQVVDQPINAARLQTLQGEWGSGTVPQEALQPGPVPGLNATTNPSLSTPLWTPNNHSSSNK